MSAGGFTGTGPVTSIPGVCGEVVYSASSAFRGILISGADCPSGMGRTSSGVTITSSSVLVLFSVREVKSLPSSGMSPSPGILLNCLGHALVQQAADDETLPFLQLDFGLHAARAQRRNRESLEYQAVGKVERADFGRHLQPDRPARRDYGSEIDAHAKLAELNGHCAEAAAAALQCGIRELAARQEAGAAFR